MRHGRLLPESLSAEGKKQLAADLQDPSRDSSLQKLVVTFPKVDDLDFDGQRYSGGNLSFIDSMLGESGRPIAFDRELPALLVPLTPEAEATLIERRAAFQAGADTLKIRETADQALGEGASALMFADGAFLRAYAGGFDDLYFHLFQNGNGPSALAFCAFADGLVERVYQPVNGLRKRGSVPVAGFDLDDILSDGGKTAVRRHLRTQSERAGEPFQQFAFRVLPSIVAKVRTLPAGARFIATHAEILRALQLRQHFYPTQVPPLYRSPDRFLGWAGAFFIPVANGPALPPGAADSWYPLPERKGRGDQGAEGVASARLFESSSAPELAWEDPKYSHLLADPDEPTEPPKAPAASPSSPPGASSSKVESDPRRRAANTRLIAVVTPTAEEAKEYRAAIAASDDKLRAIEQIRGRIRLLRQFIEGVASPGGSPDGKREPEPLQRALAADLASFERDEGDLAAHLQEALKERADLRTELEDRLRRDRVRPWQGFESKSGEAEPVQELKLVL
jgi:hypothetical protein